uniref:Uncharacterized protein n=1 Tax=Candidatus Methanogaster sp. ANME-2c ERB4 TaxID=2759911 RepID=A0A7G9YLX8_9EURY|nr:hypothetical protein KNGNHFEO_00008 [Methanosarcinales archaeon ANME-2c ERB4]
MNEEKFEPIWAEPKMFTEGIDDAISKRISRLPYMLHPYNVPDQNLYSIYYEAYRAFVFGLNNAGLMLLGQLLEVTLKEIILLKTGKKKTGMFGNAINFAKKNQILNKNDINVLESFKNLVRNPYMHRNLEEILENIYVPIWGIPLEGAPEDWLETLKTATEGLEAGKYEPSYIRASDDPTIAAIVKSKIDEDRSIYWAWKIFLEFEILVDTYLPHEEFQKYIREHGSPFDAVTLLNIYDE